MKSFLLASLLCVTLIISGCGGTSGLSGTDVGNPDTIESEQQSTSPVNPNTESSGSIMILSKRICDKVGHQLQLIDEDECSWMILQSTEIDTEIGLQVGAFPTLGDASAAETRREIFGNNDNTLACGLAIAALTAESPEIQAFRSDNPQVSLGMTAHIEPAEPTAPYHFEAVFPAGICQQVF